LFLPDEVEIDEIMIVDLYDEIVGFDASISFYETERLNVMN